VARRVKPPLSPTAFARHMSSYFAVALALLGVSLVAGMAGYHYFEGLPYLDGFLNASMLLGGMGPVDAPKTDGGKLFEGLYALYAGLLFLLLTAILLGPVFHHALRRFHFEDVDEG
jgi:hypothetical protein